MKTRTGIALALAIALLSCTTKNDASVELAAICGLPDDATQCTFTSKCDTLLMVRPWVATRWSAMAPNSLDVVNHLELPVQINNRLKPNDNQGQFRTNTNDFTIEEFRLSFSSTPDLRLPARTFPLNQLVPADGTATAMVTLIPEQTMLIIDAANAPILYPSTLAPNAYVTVTVKAFGHTRDGRSIETEEWDVPVDVFDVDVPGVGTRSFDPACAGVLTGVCPNAAQTATISCE